MKNKSVYTVETACQDCYKCVRNCPVKAIEVSNHSAKVVSEMCISCGKCINVCPASAKKYRHDLDIVKSAIVARKSIASLAPSFFADYTDTDKKKIIKALKKIGFWGVSETALGAEIVSQNVSKYLETDQRIFISSACPVAVDYINKYKPELSEFITPFLSPLGAHSTFLKEQYKEIDPLVIFIGPCIAKKDELEQHSVDFAITFEELDIWLAEEKISIADIDNSDEESFIPYDSKLCRIYPIDGGMNKTIFTEEDVAFMNFSGMDQIKLALDGLSSDSTDKKLFLELLSCDGGCVNGPCSKSNKSVIERNIAIEEKSAEGFNEYPKLEIAQSFLPDRISEESFSDDQIKSALKQIGKEDKASELNCGGCGYDSCKSFANAMLSGKAETSMCVSYMRQLAANKANALIKAMPSGLVIVDNNMVLRECNRPFAALLGEDILTIFDASESLENADFKMLFDHYKYFENVLFSNEKIEKRLTINNTILQLTVFPIEEKRLVGGILRDITEPSVLREEIIKNTKTVIKKNLQTVQQIAYLLGENAAESEVVLNSIVDSFKVGDDDKA